MFGVGLIARMICDNLDECTGKVARPCEFFGELGGIFHAEKHVCKTYT